MPPDDLIGFSNDVVAFTDLLGKGAMGAVYRGRQVRLDRTVAIKVIAAHLAEDQDYLDRFNREAKTLARLQHQNIVGCFDFGPFPGPRGRNLLLMVMEYVDGPTLGAMARAESLTVARVLELYRQSCEGLAAAHAIGIVHRDIKPDNIMITTTGVAKLADFGLAKGRDDSSSLTQVGTFMGTPAYIAPEICRGKQPTAASDIYSMGCSIFHTLSGETPYRTASSMECIYHHTSSPVPDLAERVPALAALAPILRRCLNKDPAGRPADAAALAKELAKWIPLLPTGLTCIRRQPTPRPDDSEAAKQLKERAVQATMALDLAPLVGKPPPLEVPSADPGGSGGYNPDFTAMPPVPPPPPSRPVAPGTSRVTTGGARRPELPPASAPGSERRPSSSPGTGRTGAGSERRLREAAPQLPAIPPAPAPAAATATGGASAKRNYDATAMSTIPFPLPADYVERKNVPPPPIVAPPPIAAPEPPKAAPNAIIRNSVEQGRRHQAAARIAAAEKFMANGNLAAALAELKHAAEILPTESERAPVLARAKAVADRINQGRTATIAVAVLAAVLVVGGGGWYAWTTFGPHPKPDADGPADQAPQATGVGTRPAPGADQIEQTVAGLEKALGDNGVTYPDLVARATAILPDSGERSRRVQTVIDQAKAQIANLQQDLDSISATALTDPAEALTMADGFRASKPRAGILAQRLPLPGRLLITGSGFDLGPGAAIVTVAGHRLPGTDATGNGKKGVLFCRSAVDETDLVIDAPGCRTANVAVKADADPGEKTVPVELTPAPMWNLPPPAAAPAWTRLQGQGGCVVVANDSAVRVVDPLSGQILQTVGPADVPGIPLHFLWQALPPVPAHSVFATSTGQVFAAPSDRATLTPFETVRDGDAVISQLVTRALVLNMGELGWFSSGHDTGGWLVGASCNGRAMWNQRIEAKLAPWLATDEERLMVVEDTDVHLLDQQDGHELAHSPLPAARSGVPASLDDANLLAVPMSSGLAVLRRAKDGSYAPVEVTGLTGTMVGELVADGDGLLVTRGTTLALYVVAGPAAERTLDPVWSVPLPAGRSFVPGLVLNATTAIAADDAGAVRLLARSDGHRVLTVTIPGTVAAPPLMMRDQLMVADAQGGVVGFSLKR